MEESNPQQRRNINVPNLADELYEDQRRNGVHITDSVPPFFSTTESIVTERYNSDPYFLRATYYVLPSSEYGLECVDLPLALVATPFAGRGACVTLPSAESCAQCRSYFNCFTKKIENSYMCNICNYAAPATTEVGSCMQHSTIEIPAFQKGEEPELPRPIFMFVFDLSLPWIEHIIETVSEICTSEDFATLYGYVCFLVINGGLTIYGGLAVHDNPRGKVSAMNMFGHVLPKVPSNVFIESTDTETIKVAIRRIAENGVLSREAWIDMGLEFVAEASEYTTGMKVALFTDVLHETFNYEEFIGKTKNTVVNIFTTQKTTQRNTLHSLAFYSAGKIFSYPAALAGPINSDIRAVCLTRTAFNVNITLKLSDNLAKGSVITPILEDNNAITHMPGIEATSAATFLLGLKGFSKSIKYIQLQITFRDYDGCLKMRVFNHSFPTGTPAQVYSALSPDTIFAVLAKLFVSEKVPIENTLVKTLVNYRTKCCVETSSTQFVLPEALKMLPVLIQAFSKHPLVTTDSSAYKPRIISMSTEGCLRLFYPRLFALSEYTTLNETRCLALSMQSIDNSEIYILDNGTVIMIYIASRADNMLFDRLFYHKEASLAIQPPEANEEAEVLHSAIRAIEAHYNRQMHVEIVLAGSLAETGLLSTMLEDAANGAPDYVDFIFKLHFKVQKGG